MKPVLKYSPKRIHDSCWLMDHPIDRTPAGRCLAGPILASHCGEGVLAGKEPQPDAKQNQRGSCDVG